MSKFVPVTKDDLLAIYSAGGRNRREASHARPAREYGDPARTIEFESEIDRQRKLKKANKMNARKIKQAKGNR